MKSHALKGFGVPIVVLCTIVGCLNAEWWRTYGDDETQERGYCVQQTSDGGYVAVGDKDSDLWLIKTDGSGELIWSHAYGVIGETDYGRCVRQTTDGGYIVTGSTGTDSKLWLLKTDSTGDTLWTKTFDDHGSWWGEQTTDGGYVLISYSGHNYDGFHVFKTDSLGDTLWSSYSGELNVGRCVRETSDGGYIFAAFYIVLPEDYAVPFIGKLDSGGKPLWGSGPLASSGIAECVQETSDGGYIVLTYDTYPPIDLVKTDSLGNTLWTKDYGDWRTFLSAQQTTDGGYIIAGTQEYPGENKKCLLIKTNADGNATWERVYIGDYDGVSGSFVQQTVDNGYIMCGASSVSNNVDLFLIKTDSLGLLGVEEPPSSPVTPVTPVTHLEITNPIGSEITLRYSNCPQGFHASIFDASGRKVDEIQSPQTQGVTPWGGGRGPGVYFIVSDEGSSQVSKVILVR